MDRNDEIFKGKSLNDIFQDIYNKSSEKDRQIKMLIGELRPLITNIGDATVIVPLIKEYMEVAIRNDDAIVKMAEEHWDRPESVFQHIPELLRESINKGE